jgi:hypothetical protein
MSQLIEQGGATPSLIRQIGRLGPLLGQKAVNALLANPAQAVKIAAGLLRTYRGEETTIKIVDNRPTPRPKRSQKTNKNNNNLGPQNMRITQGPSLLSTSLGPMPLRYGQAKPIPSEGMGLRVSGREYLSGAGYSPAQVGAFMTDVSNVFTYRFWMVGPANYGNLDAPWRLTAMSRLFDKYRFRSLKITYVPISGTSREGVISLGYCSDPSASLRGFNNILECEPSIISNLYTPFSLNLPTNNSRNNDDLYYVKPLLNTGSLSDVRESKQGIFMSTITGPSGDDPVETGYFVLDYVCDFYAPCPAPP